MACKQARMMSLCLRARHDQHGCERDAPECEQDEAGAARQRLRLVRRQLADLSDQRDGHVRQDRHLQQSDIDVAHDVEPAGHLAEEDPDGDASADADEDSHAERHGLELPADAEDRTEIAVHRKDAVFVRLRVADEVPNEREVDIEVAHDVPFEPERQVLVGVTRIRKADLEVVVELHLQLGRDVPLDPGDKGDGEGRAGVGVTLDLRPSVTGQGGDVPVDLGLVAEALLEDVVAGTGERRGAQVDVLEWVAVEFDGDRRDEPARRDEEVVAAGQALVVDRLLAIDLAEGAEVLDGEAVPGSAATMGSASTTSCSTSAGPQAICSRTATITTVTNFGLRLDLFICASPSRPREIQT